MASKALETKQVILAATIVAVLLVKGFQYYRDFIREPPVDRAYRICHECGMQDDDINHLIQTVRNRGLSREEEIDLFDATFGPEDTHRDACEPCVQAVLDAAGVRNDGG